MPRRQYHSGGWRQSRDQSAVADLRRVIGALVIGLLALAWLPGNRAMAQETPEYITVWESGGLSASTLEAVRVATAMEQARFVIRRSGSLRLMGVTRGETSVQRPSEGFGYPMATLAAEIDDPSLDPEIASAIGAGLVVLSERSAALRGAIVGDVLEIEGWNREVVPLEIGAVVPDGRADWHEIVMSDDTAVPLELDRASSVVISGGRLGSVPSTLRWFTSSRAVRIGSANEPTTFTDPTLPAVAVKERFGEFAFRPTGAGDSIEIDPAWLDANIVDVAIPGLGPFRCNRAVVPYIRAAVSELAASGLMESIDYNDFQLAGGCFNSRMARGGDKGFALSRHAWGIAIDFNPSTNRYGAPVTLDPAVGDVMRRWGFAWGATWTVPDGMHFEWVRSPVAFDVCAPVRVSGPLGAAWTVEASADPCTNLG